MSAADRPIPERRGKYGCLYAMLAALGVPAVLIAAVMALAAFGDWQMQRSIERVERGVPAGLAPEMGAGDAERYLQHAGATSVARGPDAVVAWFRDVATTICATHVKVTAELDENQVVSRAYGERQVTC